MMGQEGRDRMPLVKEGFTLREPQIRAIATALGAVGGAGRLGFTCGGFGCICSGDPDCNDMFETGICGDAMCFEDAAGGVVCICIRNR
jgi:hypothetical protein